MSWIERETGVVHLDTEHFFVHVETSNPPVELPLERPLSYDRTTGVIIEALLEFYRDRRFTLRELANQIDVTKGRVSQVFSQLLTLGILRAEGKTRSRVYELPDPGRVLDDWARSGTTSRESVTPMYVWSRTPAELYRRFQALDVAGISWAIGGVAAAHAYVPTLSVLPTPELWVQATIPAERVALALSAEIVGAEEAPNLTIWQSGNDPALTFRERIESPAFPGSPLWVISRSRAYVEARSAGGRGVDAAEALREEMGL